MVVDRQRHHTFFDEGRVRADLEQAALDCTFGYVGRQDKILRLQLRHVDAVIEMAGEGRVGLFRRQRFVPVKYLLAGTIRSGDGKITGIIEDDEIGNPSRCDAAFIAQAHAGTDFRSRLGNHHSLGNTSLPVLEKDSMEKPRMA